MKAFIKYARSLPTPYNESMSLLQSIAKILGFVIHTLERYSGPPSEQDMEKLIDGLNLIRDDTTKLHEIPSWQFVLPKSGEYYHLILTVLINYSSSHRFPSSVSFRQISEKDMFGSKCNNHAFKVCIFAKVI